MPQELSWEHLGVLQKKEWYSESHLSAPRKLGAADDTLKADEFYRKASEGQGFIWLGDFQNAKQLLQAVQRRIEKNKKAPPLELSPQDIFHKYRQTQSHKAQLLAKLLIPIEPGFRCLLKRAPDIQSVLEQSLPSSELSRLSASGFLISLRELLGMIGASEWRKRGVEVASLGSKIHAHYGLFSPVRGEYLELVINTPLPPAYATAFDIGTGTGVLAALLARRGIPHVIATDIEPRALVCARENMERLGFLSQVQIVQADLFPDGKADLVVCNPPWLPARPTSRLERALYDEDSQMLKSFLQKVPAHLNPEGQVWLIISNLAELLGLRSSQDLMSWISEAGLIVKDKHSTTPRHSKAQNEEDPLYAYRSKEITQLFVLGLST